MKKIFLSILLSLFFAVPVYADQINITPFSYASVQTNATDATWTTIQGANGDTLATYWAGYTVGSVNDTYNNLQRYVVKYDTASINGLLPLNAVIDGYQISTYVAGAISCNFSTDWAWYYVNTSDTTTVIISDFENVSSSPASNVINYTDINTNVSLSQPTNFDITDTSSLNLSDVTSFSFRNKNFDGDNVDPNDSATQQCLATLYDGFIPLPTLVVNYHVPTNEVTSTPIDVTPFLTDYGNVLNWILGSFIVLSFFTFLFKIFSYLKSSI